ncbi:MAG: hypothetical protein FWH41_04825 [Treponema sp.]|nr:hypothetical protein [Treponema sp.]
MRGTKPQDDQNQKEIFLPASVDLKPNSVNLLKINCNSGVTVPLQLLAIDKAIECNVDTAVCANSKSNHNGQKCCISSEQFAHIYITTENQNAFIKHYIFVFVENTKIGKYDELINILYHSVCWLKIENERPHFYIYYHGKQPAVDNTLDEARKNITHVLRSKLSYKPGESFCTTSKIRNDATYFTIYDSNPYQFKIS